MPTMQRKDGSKWHWGRRKRSAQVLARPEWQRHRVWYDEAETRHWEPASTSRRPRLLFQRAVRMPWRARFRYLLVETGEFTDRYGRVRRRLVWEGECVVCGEMFRCWSGPTVGSLPRACPAHRPWTKYLDRAGRRLEAV